MEEACAVCDKAEWEFLLFYVTYNNALAILFVCGECHSVLIREKRSPQIPTTTASRATLEQPGALPFITQKGFQRYAFYIAEMN